MRSNNVRKLELIPTTVKDAKSIDQFVSRLTKRACLRISNLGSPFPQRKDAPVDVIDLFSGCGGLSLGFEAVSSVLPAYKAIGALDIDVHANSTFKRNYGLTPIDTDVRNLALMSSRQLHSLFGRKNYVERKKPLIVVGGPPCQGFSSHRKKDKRTDPRNTLLRVFGQIAAKLQPDVILMENVPDILAEKHWDYFNAFKSVLVREGYNVKAKILNAAEFGVPQERFRAVVLACRQDFNFPIGFVTRERFRTVRDAIGDLPSLKVGEPSCADSMHITSKHRKETVDILRKVPKNGGSRPRGVGPKCLDRVAGFYDVYGRLYWDKPAITITARCRTPSCGRFAHPEQDRGLSVREAALLQGFPKSFVFEGPFDDKFKQIGNAVTPPLATALAAHVLGLLMKSSLRNIAESTLTDEDHVSSPLSNSYSSVIAGIKRRKMVEVISVS